MHREPSASDPQKTRRPAAPVSDVDHAFLSVCDALEEMLLVLDHCGEVLYANRAAAERLERPKQELIGSCLWDFCAPDARQRAEELVARAVQLGVVQGCSLPLVGGDGGPFRAETRVTAGRWQGRDVVFVVMCDLSQVQRIVERLREAESRLRLVSEHVIDVLFMLRLEQPVVLPGPGEPLPQINAAEMMQTWRLVFATPSVQRLLGYTVAEVLALGVDAVLTPEARETLQRMVSEDLPVALAQGPGGFPRRTQELQLVHKDGSPLWCEITAKFAVDEQGRLFGVIGALRDISDRKQAEQARQEHEQRFRLLLENMPDFVALLDARGIIQYMNRDSITVPTAELLDSNGLRTLRPEYRPLTRECLERAVRRGEVQRMDVEDIIGRYFSCRMVPVGDEPATRQVILIATDVTEQRRFQQRLLRKQQFLRRLLDLHEQERQLTACEIHDGVAQQLVAARFQFEASQQLQAANPEAAAAAFAKGLDLLDQGLAEVRRVISGVRPPILDEQGVVAAVEYFIASLRERLTVEIEFTHEACGGRLPGLLETTIFRVIQEAVTNACRHSQSPKVGIQLVQHDESLQITVRDWGVGFDPQQVSPSRFGLQSIRERARLLGGRAEIDTAPGKGTTVTVELPLVGPHDESSA